MTEAGFGWDVYSNPDQVLVCIADNLLARPCDIDERFDITDRAAVHLLRDPEEADILTRIKQGRSNCYFINSDAHLRPPPESHSAVAELWSTMLGQTQSHRAEHLA